MEREPYRGYFPKLAKSLLVSETLGLDGEARREFAVKGLVLNFVSVSRYMGVYLGPQDQLEAWVKP